MSEIHISTVIDAPMQEVFQLSLDIDFHQESASQTQEKAIAGLTSGIIGLGETVTWRGKHFGFWLTHKSIISAYKAPNYFVDEMVSGHFKEFRHEHFFRESNKKTIMTDMLSYEVPYGISGRIIDRLFLKKYLTKFLKMRNLAIKKSLELK